MARTHITVIIGAILLALAAVAPPAEAAPRSPQECAASLDCGLEEIQLMSMSDRLDMVRDWEAGPVAAYLGTGTDPGRWRNVEGIVMLFRDESLGARGGWVSYVDAGILEGVERGIAIAIGKSTETGGNPGAELWADYLTSLKAGDLGDRTAHDHAWSLAEQASTDHGIAVAEGMYGEHATPAMSRFFELSQFYRYMLRNRPALADVLTRVNGLSPAQQEDFYDWATDVTNADAGRTGAQFMWSMAELDPAGTVFTTADVFQAYFQELYPEYLAATRRSLSRP